MSNPIPVIIDCDPGHDDAIALMLALSSPALKVLGVTTCSGNQTIEKTTKNARSICAFLGAHDIPIAQGRSAPLLTDGKTAASAHGESGLDGPQLPDPVSPLSPLSAVELMAELLAESTEKLTLVPTGPLTNIATLILCYPHLIEKIQRISLMGGSIISGCSDKGASEFNIFVDAYAAHIVFTSGIPLVMSGLDMTNYCTIGFDEKDAFRSIGLVGTFVAELCDFFGRGFEFVGWPGVPVHDACAVAYLIDPTLFQTREMHVAIDLNGENTYASTVADYEGLTDAKPNATVCVDADRERFVQLLLDACKTYEEAPK